MTIKARILFFLLYACSLFALEPPIYTAQFDTRANGIFLPVRIDGKECDFLFDTGASFVVLDKSYDFLLSAPLDVQEAQARTGMKFPETIMTPNGELVLKMYKSIPLKLGRLQVANRLPYMTADLKALWPFAGRRFCGILGGAFLHQFRWELDFANGEIRAYIGAEPYSGAYQTRTPLVLSEGYIPRIKLLSKKTPLLFDIDLGDNGTGRVDAKTFLLLKEQGQVLRSRMQEVVTVSARSKSEESRLGALTLAGVTYSDLVLQTSRQNALGLGFFKRHNVILDFPFGMLYLQHHKDYNVREETDKSGVRVILQDGKFIVFSISPLEGAVISNLQEGDEIIGIREVDELSLYTIRRSLRGAKGEELHLRLKRKGAVHEGKILLGEDPL